MAQPRPGDVLRVHYTGRLENGTVFDSSKGRDPLEITVGSGDVIPDFEEAVMRMEPGQESTITIPADRAYGPHRDDLMVAIETGEFPGHIKPEVGQQLQIRQESGQPAIVTIAEVTATHVTIDANHPLAGEDLTFDLELVEIREGS